MCGREDAGVAVADGIASGAEPGGLSTSGDAERVHPTTDVRQKRLKNTVSSADNFIHGTS